MKLLRSFKKVILLVAILNFIYFFVEFIVALNIRSVSLLTDSVDFIQDASVNFLIFFAISLSIIERAKISILLSFIMLLPGLTALWAIVQQIKYQNPTEPLDLSAVAFGALIINGFCTYVLMRFKNFSGSLTRAAFLSARNDVLASIAIIIVAIITYIYSSIWPDILVGLFIGYISAESALEIYKKAIYELKKGRRGSLNSK